MKKLLLTIAVVLTMGLCANAQYAGGMDSFFNDWNDVSNGLERDLFDIPNLPNAHGYQDDASAPLGCGLLVLTALGAGYAIRKRNQ